MREDPIDSSQEQSHECAIRSTSLVRQHVVAKRDDARPTTRPTSADARDQPDAGGHLNRRRDDEDDRVGSAVPPTGE
jgi:hypothetical protein